MKKGKLSLKAKLYLFIAWHSQQYLIILWYCQQAKILLYNCQTKVFISFLGTSFYFSSCPCLPQFATGLPQFVTVLSRSVNLVRVVHRPVPVSHRSVRVFQRFVGKFCSEMEMTWSDTSKVLLDIGQHLAQPTVVVSLTVTGTSQSNNQEEPVFLSEFMRESLFILKSQDRQFRLRLNVGTVCLDSLNFVSTIFNI